MAISEGERVAMMMTDVMLGRRLPRDDEPARLIKCLTNNRYLLSVDDSFGAVTVAKHHARRFATRTEAMSMLARLEARGSGVPYRIVRLKLKGEREEAASDEKGGA